MGINIKCAALIILLLSSLQACDWIDDLGRHMPVMGERCENWQCFTESGHAQSEATKRALAVRDAPERAKRIPLNGADNPATESPVENRPAAPTTPKAPTPFDMTPDQLDELPPTGSAQ